MSDEIVDINYDIREFPLLSLDSVYELIEKYYSHSPVKEDDFVISVVLVDLTRYPVALTSRFRSSNFKGLHLDHYDQLQESFQIVEDNSIIYKLVMEENLIVIEDIDELKVVDAGVGSERKYLMENEWKSIILHSLFHEGINFGFIAFFTQNKKLNTDQIEILTEFLSDTMPALNRKLFTAAYIWKSTLYKKDITELETNLSDLVVAINSKGVIIRLNKHGNYYFGQPPENLLGKILKEISAPLYQGIQKSIEIDWKKEAVVEVEITIPSGEKRTLELNAWKTGLSTSDETIVCFASDITLMKMYEQEISKKR